VGDVGDSGGQAATTEATADVVAAVVGMSGDVAPALSLTPPLGDGTAPGAVVVRAAESGPT